MRHLPFLIALLLTLPSCFDDFHEHSGSASTSIPPPSEDAYQAEAHVHTGSCGCGHDEDVLDLDTLPEHIRRIDVSPDFFFEEIWTSEGAASIDASWLVNAGCAEESAPFSGPQRWTVVHQRPGTRVAVATLPGSTIDLNLFTTPLHSTTALPPDSAPSTCTTSAHNGPDGGELLEFEPTDTSRYHLIAVTSPPHTSGEARVIWMVE